MKKIEVVAAVIRVGDEILCVQRNFSKYDYISYKYEFPGGKVEANESLQEALRREIDEELNMQIEVNDLLITVHHHYPDFEIIMHTFNGTSPSKDLTLNEHLDFKWLTVNEMSELDWAGADVPIVDKLKENKNVLS